MMSIETRNERWKSNTSRSHRRRTRWRLRPARVAGYVALVGISIVSVIPLLWMMLTSLRPSNTVFAGPIVPEHFTIRAYSYAITQLHIFLYFSNSLYITAGTVALVLAIATLAGYGFGRLRFRARDTLFVVLMSSLFLPGAAILIPIFLELKEIGLIGTRVGLILINVGTGVPFATLLMRTFFAALPEDLSDAAKIDGAGELRTFWHVMLPLAGPGVATIAIFQVLFTWNELMFANALIAQKPLLPLQPELYSLVGQYATNWPVLTASLVIAVAPILIVYVALQRRYVAGLTAAATKA